MSSLIAYLANNDLAFALFFLKHFGFGKKYVKLPSVSEKDRCPEYQIRLGADDQKRK